MTEVDSLDDMHGLPWDEVQGLRVRVRQEYQDHPTPVDEFPDTKTREIVGAVVGRRAGKGLQYDPDAGRTIVTAGSRRLFLENGDTVYEVCTDTLDNELLAVLGRDEDDTDGYPTKTIP